MTVPATVPSPFQSMPPVALVPSIRNRPTSPSSNGDPSQCLVGRAVCRVSSIDAGRRVPPRAVGQRAETGWLRQAVLIERADHPGFWQSVTGSQDPGETLRETAIREVGEETGIDATRHELADWQVSNVYEIYAVWRHRYAPGVTHNTEHVFGLRLPGRLDVTLAPKEHVRFRWVPWQAAAAEVFSWSNRQAILMLPEKQAHSDARVP